MSFTDYSGLERRAWESFTGVRCQVAVTSMS
jgi:hypothetical protein